MFPGRSTCRAGNVAHPGTEEEIVSIVSAATKAGKKMKVVTSFAHSIPKLACPDGVDGLLISTKYLNHVVNVDAAAMTMTVESGMALSQLIEEAAKAGLALPHAPYWSGSTIGGILSTGPGGPDEGYAKIRILNESHEDLNESHEDLNAAKVSLRVLGVTLKLEPMFKRSITYVKKIDMDLGDQAVSFGKQHEFADMSWYPSQRQVVYRVDDRVSPDVSGEGLYDFTGFRDTLSLVAESIRTTEETQESNCLDEMNCVSAGLTTTILGAIAYGLTNNASSAYLGNQEDALDFDITYYRSKDPLTPRLYEDIPEEIEQMAVFKYGGLPHWGKNRNIAFDGVFKKYRNVTEFLKVKEAYDPSAKRFVFHGVQGVPLPLIQITISGKTSSSVPDPIGTIQQQAEVQNGSVTKKDLHKHFILENPDYFFRLAFKLNTGSIIHSYKNGRQLVIPVDTVVPSSAPISCAPSPAWPPDPLAKNNREGPPFG
ncbi:hypothetical protein SLEP1_g559 [Rubroshorea leprosula]|uniref:FAD-binding PCMH-type domain-containing protein n=1 Tax=Rubroshorea leprosula TaxID=152421 RepID=A0AAV5HGJ9_9ROSI|nr:hypothetical protein SLEP1_g559 [Rubroshorea leprosula]